MLKITEDQWFSLQRLAEVLTQNAATPESTKAIAAWLVEDITATNMQLPRDTIWVDVVGPDKTKDRRPGKRIPGSKFWCVAPAKVTKLGKARGRTVSLVHIPSGLHAGTYKDRKTALHAWSLIKGYDVEHKHPENLGHVPNEVRSKMAKL